MNRAPARHSSESWNDEGAEMTVPYGRCKL